MKRFYGLGLLLSFMGVMVFHSGYCAEESLQREDSCLNRPKPKQKISPIGKFELLCHMWEIAHFNAVQVTKAIETALDSLNLPAHGKTVLENINRLAEVASKEGLNWPESKKCSLVMICDLAFSFLDDRERTLEFWKNQRVGVFDQKTIDDRIARATFSVEQS